MSELTEDRFVNAAPREGDPKALDRVSPNIPEKLAGKSPEEIAESYLQLERKLGEQSMELGQLRRLSQEAVARATQAPPREPPHWDPKNPEPYLEWKMAQATQPFQQQAALAAKLNFEAELDKAHPQWREESNDEGFTNWVSQSKVRRELFIDAQSNFDSEAANELLSTYKAVHGVKASAEKAVEKAVKRETKMRAMATERGGSGNETFGKRVRASDIRAMMQRDPDGYRRRQAEIVKMYREGRVIRD